MGRWALRHGRVFAVLEARDFRLLWLGQAISAVGDPMLPFAAALLVLDRGDGVVGMGVVFGARSLAGLLVAALGGLLADRRERRRVMIATDVSRAVLVTAIALAPGRISTPVLAVLVFMVGAAGALFQPAYNALLPSTVPADRLQDANALTSVTLRIATLGSPVLAGAMAVVSGARGALLFDAATFAASIVTLALLREAAPPAAGEGRGLWASARDGLEALRARRWIWLMTLCAFAQVPLSVAPWVVLLPILTQAHYGGAPAYASLLAAFSLGSLVGGGLSGAVRSRAPGTVACLCLAPFAFMLTALALAAPLWVVLAATVAAGAGLEMFTVLFVTAVQRDVPNQLLGRVFAIDQVGTLAITPLAYAAVAPVASLWGPTPVLLGGAAATLACTWLPLLDGDVRRFAGSPPVPATDLRTRP